MLDGKEASHFTDGVWKTECHRVTNMGVCRILVGCVCLLSNDTVEVHFSTHAAALASRLTMSKAVRHSDECPNAAFSNSLREFTDTLR